MLHRLRAVLVRPGRERLSGMVEVDETYIGGEEPGLRGGRASLGQCRPHHRERAGTRRAWSALPLAAHGGVPAWPPPG